jgi:hypothetical protein
LGLRQYGRVAPAGKNKPMKGLPIGMAYRDLELKRSMP